MGMNGKHCLLEKCHEFKKCAQDLEEIFEEMSCLISVKFLLLLIFLT